MCSINTRTCVRISKNPHFTPPSIPLLLFITPNRLSTMVPACCEISRSSRSKVKVHYEEDVISDDDEYLCKSTQLQSVNKYLIYF